MKTGIELIAEERREQIIKHGRTVERDVKENLNQQLTVGAKVLIESDSILRELARPANWNNEIWKRMANKPYKERLIIAGALIAAEIDRLQVIEKIQSHDQL